MRCKAAILRQFNHPLAIEEIEVAGPRSGEVMVRIVSSGVCHSDLSSVKGLFGDALPSVLGHEGAGVVMEVGSDVKHVAVGDHVVLSWKPTCGRCRYCSRGRSHLCDQATWADGGHMRDGTSRLSFGGEKLFHYAGVSTFAEISVVDAQLVIPIDKSIPLANLCLIGCAVTTGVGAALNTAKIRRADSVAIVGCGGVGLSTIQGARIAGAATIIAIDRSARSLVLARELGATHTIDSSVADPVEAVFKWTAGGVDVAFEAVGRRETMELAIKLLSRGGEAILIGVARSDVRVEFAPFTLVRREHQIRGSYYGSASPTTEFPRLADLYRAGQLNLDSMVRYRRLEEINDIFKEMESGSVGRDVIKFAAR